MKNPRILVACFLLPLAAAVCAAETAIASRELVATGRYLYLPVKTGAPKVAMTMIVEGKKLRDFAIEYAEGVPDFWVHADVSEWRGKLIRLEAASLTAGPVGLGRIESSDALKDFERLYDEPLRPQFHFSSRRGWLNDPNGLMHYNGTYHLFYQHNPYGWSHGNMTWGHATSRDLVRWDEQGDVLHPDATGTMYSGSGVVDWRNSSGLGQPGGSPPLVLIYTAAGGTNPLSRAQPFTQCLAYSNDAGLTWRKYEHNPVLVQRAEGNRDPKVIWHEPTQRWVMALYVGYIKPGEFDAKGRPARSNTIEFFASANLREWTFLSQFDGFYECPDLFELPIDGDEQNKRWIIHGANADYRVGHFDGKAFIAETPLLPGPRGGTFYAPQTFSDAPDGRRIQIGWGRVAMPGMPFNQQMFLGTELSLRGTPAGPRLAWQPVREFATLRGRTHHVAPRALAPGENPLAATKLRHFDLEAEFEPGRATEVGFILHGIPVTYDVRRETLTIGQTTVSLPLTGGRLKVRLLVDRMSLEIFGNGGLLYLPLGFSPPPGNESLEVFARGGIATLHLLQLFELHSSWTLSREGPQGKGNRESSHGTPSSIPR